MLTINLLPESERRALERRRFQKTLRHFGLGLFLVSLVAAAALFFMKVALTTQLTQTEDRLQRLFADGTVRAVLAADQAVASFNVLLKKVELLEAQRLAWSEMLIAIAGAAGEGIRLDRLTVETPTRTVTLSGQASTRGALLDFSEALRAQPRVVRLDSPLANLIKERDVAFKFTLYLK